MDDLFLPSKGVGTLKSTSESAQNDQKAGTFESSNSLICQYCLFGEDQIIVELKAVERLCKAHEVQTVNYLTATGLDIGLLINFGAESLEFKKKFRLRHAPNPVNPV